MRCREASERLQYGERGIGSLVLRAHVAVCGRCRAEARSLSALRQAVREAGRFEPPTDLLPAILAVPHEAAPAQTTTKENRNVRRIIYATLAMLVVAIGAAVWIPGRGGRPGAESILLGVAHAMEQAKSLHIVFRGTESGVNTPSGLRVMPGVVDFWLSSRAIYGRGVTPNGTVVFSSGADADTREMWVYSGDDKIRLVADLTPIADRAAEIISEASKLFRADQIMKTAGKVYPDAKMSVATETRGGRKVAVVTVTGTLKTSPLRVSGRSVFVVDADSDRLLTMRQYAKTKGTHEQLVQVIERVDYDAALPPESRTVSLPAGTKTVQATAGIEETAKTIALVVKSGKHVLRFEVPRDTK